MIKENVLLSNYSNYKIGGPAKYFLMAKNSNELEKGLIEWHKISESFDANSKKIFILGKGTNVLFDDQGFDGLVIRYENEEITKTDSAVTAGAGATISDLNNFCIQNGLSGMEWSGGLPGTVGGAIFGNAGAFGGETKDNILKVKSLDILSHKIIERNNAECQFGYRQSIFKKNTQKEVILEAVFNLTPGDQAKIQEQIQEKIDYRLAKQPLDLPSAGSVFKNISLQSAPEELKEKFAAKIKNDPFEVIPVAAILADADLFGLQVGGAKVSEKHPNFIVNTGSATANDVKNLIKKIQEIIKEKYEVELEPEIIIVKY